MIEDNFEPYILILETISDQGYQYRIAQIEDFLYRWNHDYLKFAESPVIFDRNEALTQAWEIAEKWYNSYESHQRHLGSSFKIHIERLPHRFESLQNIDR